jgi:ABC-type branched-subunit amino acid transport system permease subunit
VTFASFIIQLLNGLAAAASLFLVSAGLSLIFGVTRIVNFAHGSLYMLGLYGAYSLIEALGRTPLGFWSAVVLAALAVGPGAVPASRHLRGRAGDQGHRAVHLGCRGPGGPARARPVDGGRDHGPAHPGL